MDEADGEAEAPSLEPGPASAAGSILEWLMRPSASCVNEANDCSASEACVAYVESTFIANPTLEGAKAAGEEAHALLVCTDSRVQETIEWFSEPCPNEVNDCLATGTCVAYVQSTIFGLIASSFGEAKAAGEEAYALLACAFGNAPEYGGGYQGGYQGGIDNGDDADDDGEADAGEGEDIDIDNGVDADCNNQPGTTASCADVTVNGQPWHDIFGPVHDCDAYNTGGYSCTTNFFNNGYSSATACCHCGGGVTTCQPA